MSAGNNVPLSWICMHPVSSC